jgi:hypothetical protein
MSNPPEVHVSKWAFLAPLILGSILAVSALSLFVLGWVGGRASGERAVLRVQSECPKEWAELIEARGASVGLGDPELRIEGDTVLYTSTLPGHEDDQRAMPALLTQEGRLEVFEANSHGTGTQGEALANNEDIVEVFMSLDARGHPYVDVVFQPHAGARMQGEPKAMLYFLDGQQVSSWPGLMPFEGSTIRLQPRGASKKETMRLAVDWNIVLRDGMAPCAVQERSMSAVAGS